MECLGQVKINFFLIPKGKAVHTMIFSPPNHSSWGSSCGCWSRQLSLGSGSWPCTISVVDLHSLPGQPIPGLQVSKTPTWAFKYLWRGWTFLTPKGSVCSAESPVGGEPSPTPQGAPAQPFGEAEPFPAQKEVSAQPPEPLLMRQIFFNPAEATAPSPEHPGEVKPSAN